MKTRADRAIALRERCREHSSDLKARHSADKRAEREAIGQILTLEDVAGGLTTVTTGTPSGQVHTQVERLLSRLAETKAHWIIDGRRSRLPSQSENWEWTAKAACDEIDQLVPDLWDLLSPQWKRSGKMHGQYFHVYQSIDLEAMLDVQTGIQRWCSRSRNQFYREVALLKAEGDSPLEQAFRLTNHVEEQWQRNREILWFSKDEPLRSTSVGDIIVSLSSGTAWAVDRVGFQLIAEYNANQNKAIRACEALTHCFSILYEADRHQGDQQSMDSWFEVCCLELDMKAFFEELRVRPQWVGSRRTGSGRYQFTDKQLAWIGRLDPDQVPDLDEWYRERETC